MSAPSQESSDTPQDDSGATRPEALLEAFVKRLGEAVTAELMADSRKRPYMYEWDEAVDLDKVETEKAEKLFFGYYDDVVNEWEENDSEYNEQRDRDSIEDQAKELLRGKLREEFESLALALGMDEDDLLEEIVDTDDDDKLSPAALDLYLHSTNYEFRGLRLATVGLDSFDLDPAKDALFDTLVRLRIDVETYIRAATDSIEGQYDADGALDDEEIKMWGMADVDCDDSEDAQPWHEVYAEVVRERHQDYLRRKRMGACNFDEPGVVKAEDLIVMARDRWGHTDLYLHVAVGDKTIADVGKRAVHHDLAGRGGFDLQVHSGFICQDRDPGSELPYAVQVQAPICVAAESFSLHKDRPDTKEEDDVRLASPDGVYAELYATVYLETWDRGNGHNRLSDLDPDKTDDKALLDKALQIIARSPWYAARLALDQRPVLEHPMLRAAVDAKFDALAQDQLDRHLVECVLAYPRTGMGDVLPYLAHHIERLLEIGASPQAMGRTTVTAFEWACHNGLPSRLVAAMCPPSPAVPDAEQPQINAVTMCMEVLSDTLYISPRNTARIEACRQNLELLLRQGWSAPLEAGHCKPGSAFTKLMERGQSEFLDQILQAYEDRHGGQEHQRLCEELLRYAAQQLLVQPAAVVMARGADPVAAGVLEKLDYRAKNTNNSSDRDVLENFSSLIRAAQARRAALQACAGLGLDPAP